MDQRRPLHRVQVSDVSLASGESELKRGWGGLIREKNRMFNDILYYHMGRLSSGISLMYIFTGQLHGASNPAGRGLLGHPHGSLPES
jgi:hypothetical protein